jgi:hypothetical protein
MAQYIPHPETQEHKNARLVKSRAGITPESLKRRAATRQANQGPEVIAPRLSGLDSESPRTTVEHETGQHPDNAEHKPDKTRTSTNLTIRTDSGQLSAGMAEGGHPMSVKPDTNRTEPDTDRPTPGQARQSHVVLDRNLTG